MEIETLPNYTNSHHKKGTFKNEEGEPRVFGHKQKENICTLVTQLFRHPDVTHPLPIRHISHSEFKDDDEGIRVWWLGHATNLIQIGDKFIITDPIFDHHASPSKAFVRRVTPLPLNKRHLPKIDVILISHDHYDHLSEKSLAYIKKRNPDVTILAPLKVDKLINSWDSRYNAQKFDWRQRTTIEGITFTCMPSRHYSRRTLSDQFVKLWCSWLIETQNNVSIYFPGDTAIGPQFAEVRQMVGRPINLALMPIGPQRPSKIMREIHMNPEDARDMAIQLEAETVVPIHYGVFPLGLRVKKADHKVLKECWPEDDTLRILKIGGRIDFDGTKFEVISEEMLNADV